MRISELDDIEKAALLSAVVKRARADLNDGRPLMEMRRSRSERDYWPNLRELRGGTVEHGLRVWVLYELFSAIDDERKRR